MALYKRFYQLNDVIGSDKVYRRVGIIVRKYRGVRKIIAIRAINNFTVHRLLNPRTGVMSDTFRYHTTNNWEKLIDQIL